MTFGRTQDRGAPHVSVIIPVRNRRTLLRDALDALDAQSYRDFEVIVVDDGSDDGSDREAAEHPVAGRPVTVLNTGGTGAVGARLVGVAKSEAELLAFTDSDCVPAPEWLSSAVARIDAGAELVHGQTRPARRVRPLERSMQEIDYGLFPTCNLVMTRSAYDRVGGFDSAAGERWRFRRSKRAAGLGFGEDTVLGWAIARSGRAEYVDDMVVHHHVFPPDLRETLGRSWQMGAFPALVREVPELRRTLVRHGVLWGSRSRVPLYATIAALMTRRGGVVGFAATWWILHRYRRSVRKRGLNCVQEVLAVPPQLLVDVVQAAALTTGSLRARTLLL